MTKNLKEFTNEELFKLQNVFHEMFVGCYGEVYSMEHFDFTLQDLIESGIAPDVVREDFNTQDDYFYFDLNEKLVSLNARTLNNFVGTTLFENIEDLTHEEKEEYLKELKLIDDVLHDKFTNK